MKSFLEVAKSQAIHRYVYFILYELFLFHLLLSDIGHRVAKPEARDENRGEKNLGENHASSIDEIIVCDDIKSSHKKEGVAKWGSIFIGRR
jgi:hypothetical protein